MKVPSSRDLKNHDRMLRLFLFAIVALLGSYLYTKLRFARFGQYAHIPQLPNHLLWGHLKVFGEFIHRGIHDRHPGMIWAETQKNLEHGKNCT